VIGKNTIAKVPSLLATAVGDPQTFTQTFLRWLFALKTCKQAKKGRHLMKALFVGLFFFHLQVLTLATHFRYGQIYYDQIFPSTSGTDFWLQMQQAWRWSYFGNAPVGSNISIIGLYFDGTNYIDNQWIINSVNVPNDWFVASWIPTRATLNLPSGVNTKSFTAYTTSCCRISTLLNNRDGTWSLKALIYVSKDSNFQSMRSSLIPIATLPVNQPSLFALNVFKFQNEFNSFRFSTAAEAANGGSWVLPSPSPLIS
jgi:hypothetical protein